MSTQYKRLSREQVGEVLRNIGRESVGSLARRFGCSKQAISQIQIGRTRAGLFPELPRRPPQPPQVRGLSCHNCQRWDVDACGLGLPDPQEEGPHVAADCHLFEAVT